MAAELELYRKDRIKSLDVSAYIRLESIEDEFSAFNARDISSPNFRVEISEPALIVREVRDIMESLPGEREAKILSLKKKIREGTYSPPSLKVAEKLLKKHFHHSP